MEKELKKLGLLTTYIYNDKLNKNLLIAMKKDFKGMIRVFDDEQGVELGYITYTINGRGIFVSSLVVKEYYQQNGIARIMFNTAMVHGDIFGVNQIYGNINPTDPIRGVSNNDENSFIKEKKALKQIYKKLGCKVEGDKFQKVWKEGECFDNCCNEVKMLLSDTVVNRENL